MLMLSIGFSGCGDDEQSEPDEVTLTLMMSPAGSGTISADPANADGQYQNGTRVTLTAKANSG